MANEAFMAGFKRFADKKADDQQSPKATGKPKKPRGGKNGGGKTGGAMPAAFSPKFPPVQGNPLGTGGGGVTAPSLKKGGPVRKTGVYHLHAGEYVVPAKHRTGKRSVRKRMVTKL